MEMTPLRSSNVAAAGYDPETRELHVEFAGGSTYVYSDVDAATAAGLMTAPSPGKYLNMHVKDAHDARRL